MLNLEDRLLFIKFLDSEYKSIHYISKNRVFYLRLFCEILEQDDDGTLFEELCKATQTEHGLKEGIGTIEKEIREQCKEIYPNLKFNSVSERNFFNRVLPKHLSKFDQNKDQYKN